MTGGCILNALWQPRSEHGTYLKACNLAENLKSLVMALAQASVRLLVPFKRVLCRLALLSDLFFGPRAPSGPLPLQPWSSNTNINMESATAPGSIFDSPQPNLLIAPLDTAVHNQKHHARGRHAAVRHEGDAEHTDPAVKAHAEATGAENTGAEHYTSSAETIPMAEPQRQSSIPATSSQQQADTFDEVAAPAVPHGMALTNNVGARYVVFARQSMSAVVEARLHLCCCNIKTQEDFHSPEFGALQYLPVLVMRSRTQLTFAHAIGHAPRWSSAHR